LRVPLDEQLIPGDSRPCPICGSELANDKNGVYCWFCDYIQPLPFNENDSDNRFDSEFDIEASDSSSLTPADFFPYPEYRVNQQELIDEIFDSLNTRTHIIVNAPNGFGKTITCLAAVLPVAFNHNLKIFYCCRTHTQNDRVIQEAQQISDSCKRKIVILSLKGKANLCFQQLKQEDEPNAIDIDKACRDLRESGSCQYYNTIKAYKERDELDWECQSLIQISSVLDDDFLIREAQSRNICPYFLTLEMMKFAKVIACNYVWIFHPFIFQVIERYSEIDLTRVVLVVDEAHNLPSIATKFLSSSINEKEIDPALKDIEYIRDAIRLDHSKLDLGPNISILVQNDVNRIEGFIIMLRQYLVAVKNNIEAIIARNKGKERYEGEEIESEINKEILFQSIKKTTGLNDRTIIEFFKQMIFLGRELTPYKVRLGLKAEDIHSELTDIGEFFIELLTTNNDPGYCAYSTWTEKEHWSKLEIKGLDPYKITKRVFSTVFASLSLSGTIDPNIFKLQCLREQNVHSCEVPSSFGPEQVKALYTKSLSSNWKQRTEDMFKKYMGLIKNVASSVPGNIGVFCVSKEYLQSLLKIGIINELELIGKEVFVEQPFTTSLENKKMIEKFKENGRSRNDSVLLGVLGGRNSEGEDFPGDEMNAVIVCGVPYFPITYVIKKEISYYDSLKYGMGREIAYYYPTFQKVNQAAGRPARSMSDKSIIILADDRFINTKKRLSPWIAKNAMNDLMDIHEIKTQIDNFFLR